jgi:hypothetical protein
LNHLAVGFRGVRELEGFCDLPEFAHWRSRRLPRTNFPLNFTKKSFCLSASSFGALLIWYPLLPPLGSPPSGNAELLPVVALTDHHPPASSHPTPTQLRHNADRHPPPSSPPIPTQLRHNASSRRGTVSDYELHPAAGRRFKCFAT